MDDFEKLLNKRLEEDKDFKKLWEDDAPRKEIIDEIISLMKKVPIQKTPAE